MAQRRLLSDPPPRRILGDHHIDDLAQAILVLTRELWLVTDRMAVLEKLLEGHGIGSTEIDHYQPDQSFAAELDRRRQSVLASVLDALGGKEVP